MAVNKMSSEFGVITYINDTELMTEMRSRYSSAVYLYNGDITVEGQQFISDYGSLQIFLTGFMPLGVTVPDGYINMFNQFFPLTSYTEHPGANQEYEFYNNVNKKFKTTSDVGITPIYDGINEIILNNSQNNRGFVYGSMRRYSQSQPNSAESVFIIPIFNDDYTDFFILSVFGTYSDNYKQVRVVGGSLSNVNQRNAFIEYYKTATPDPVAPSDPYGPGGESDTGGGTGNFDGTSVDVDFATLPTLSAVDTGFITLYNPTLAQLQSLASYMWSGLFDIDTFKKLFADPMQAILGLSIVPGPVPGGTTQNVRIGNIDSGVSMTKAAAQYIDIDCGTLNVEEFWGAYLDYEPYTKAEIYLPFIGVHQIAIDDIMNKSVHIKYHIDLLSGGCACEIKCGGSVLYTFIGSCAVSIPVTGNDWTNLINGVLSAATAIGTMVATGGSSAPAAATTIASSAVNNLKPTIEKSGSISGAGGMLAGKVPVLILTRPRQALPGKQNTFTGYPAFITRLLGDLSGYTEVHSIRLSGIDGTESEIDEIEELLKGGVIF